jgi:hypothetical protein
MSTALSPSVPSYSFSITVLKLERCSIREELNFVNSTMGNNNQIRVKSQLLSPRTG